MQVDLTIADIPSDVIRRITLIGNESVHGMRLISQRWNRLAIEHLSDRNRYPVIKNLFWNRGRENWEIFIKIASRHREYFNLTNWDNLSISQASQQFAEYGHSLKGSSENKLPFTNFLCQIIKRCSRIEILRIGYLGKEIVKDLFDQIVIEELVLFEQYRFDSELVIELLQLIKSRSVRRLLLDFDAKYWTTRKFVLRDFLSDAIKVLTSIEIRVTGIEEVERGMDYNQFFANWEGKVAELNQIKYFTAKVVEILPTMAIIRIHVKALEKK